MHVVFHSRPNLWFLIQNNVFARTTFAGARFRSDPRKFPRRPIIRPEELVRRHIVKTLRSFVIDKRSPAHACCDIGCMSIPGTKPPFLKVPAGFRTTSLQWKMEETQVELPYTIPLTFSSFW